LLKGDFGDGEFEMVIVSGIGIVVAEYVLMNCWGNLNWTGGFGGHGRVVRCGASPPDRHYLMIGFCAA